MAIIAEYIRRLAVVLVVALVFLQALLGLLPAEKVHTPHSRQPWGLQAATVRRFGPRLVALQFRVIVA